MVLRAVSSGRHPSGGAIETGTGESLAYQQKTSGRASGAIPVDRSFGRVLTAVANLPQEPRGNPDRRNSAVCFLSAGSHTFLKRSPEPELAVSPCVQLLKRAGGWLLFFRSTVSSMNSAVPDFLIAAYNWTVGPIRTVNVRALKNNGQLPVAILFYHRVADTCLNGWTISRQGFTRHLDWLQANFDLVSLEESRKRIASGFNDRPTVAITFDDGYAENSEFALPLLLERRIPFSYFITLRNVVEQRPFEHDCKSHQPLPVDSLDTIRALSAIGVDIGCHTLTHPDCGKLSEPQLRREIIDAGKELEDLLGCPVPHFAFPFGQSRNMTARGFALCREFGYRAVCSSYGGMNAIGQDSFHLQRIHGDPSLARIRNWLSYSHRQLNVSRFRYEV